MAAGELGAGGVSVGLAGDLAFPPDMFEGSLKVIFTRIRRMTR
jgi:hypothetical protein